MPAGDACSNRFCLRVGGPPCSVPINLFDARTSVALHRALIVDIVTEVTGRCIRNRDGELDSRVSYKELRGGEGREIEREREERSRRRERE